MWLTSVDKFPREMREDSVCGIVIGSMFYLKDKSDDSIIGIY